MVNEQKTIRQIEIESIDAFDSHEQVIELNDLDSGLQGFIAIHSTRLGPALGGTRMFAYNSKLDALRDALRLSKAMTYKCAIAKLPFGGGKGVIIADKKIKNLNLLRAYAEAVQKLKGKFYTGEDVGLRERDVQEMLPYCDYLVGKSGLAGDPSIYAALSVFECIKTALEFDYGSDSLAGRTVAIKGLGKTGTELARLLLAEGAKIVATDVSPTAIAEAQRKCPEMKIVSGDEIFEADADIFAPCALADDINPLTLKILKAKIICGTANNQLDRPETGSLAFSKEFIYVPDYLANSGGLINVACELDPEGYSKQLVIKRIMQIKDVCKEVLTISKQSQMPTNLVADQIAEKFIRNFKK